MPIPTSLSDWHFVYKDKLSEYSHIVYYDIAQILKVGAKENLNTMMERIHPKVTNILGNIMSETTQKMTFDVVSRRVNSEGSIAYCKNASISLDTNLKGNPDAFNPAELLLTAVSACMIKGIERVTPLLKFELHGIEVKIHGVRQEINYV